MASVSPGLPLDRVATAIALSPRRPRNVRVTRHPQHDATVLGDVRLRYVDVRPAGAAAERGPPLVMVHGIASRLEEYEEMIAPLAARRRVVVMDLPGNGYSDKPDRPYTLAFLEDAILGLLDQLAIGQADLAGGSLGGNLVLRLGHRAPPRFRRLVPWGPAGTWEPMRLLGVLAGVWTRVARAAFWPVVWVQSRYWYEPSWAGREDALRETFAHYREVLGRGFARMYFEIIREQVTTSLYPIAPAIAQPTLVAWGDRDHALGMGPGVKRLVGLMPDARLRVFEGARHSLANEVPALLAAEVDAFLSR